MCHFQMLPLAHPVTGQRVSQKCLMSTPLSWETEVQTVSFFHQTRLFHLEKRLGQPLWPCVIRYMELIIHDDWSRSEYWHCQVTNLCSECDNSGFLSHNQLETVMWTLLYLRTSNKKHIKCEIFVLYCKTLIKKLFLHLLFDLFCPMFF